MIGLVFHITSEDMSATIGHKCNGTLDNTTPFPGSLILPPRASEERPWALSIRPKIPEIPGLGANGTVIFRNFIPKFWVYLARLA